MNDRDLEDPGVGVGSTQVRPSMWRRGALLGSLVLAACGGGALSNVVVVASPTGDRDRDRASLRTAFDRVRPDGKVQFAAGTYVIGGDPMELRTSGVTLLGDAKGTVLQGCPENRLATMDEETYFTSCGGLALTGARQQVRALTFEGFTAALGVQAPIDSAAPRMAPNVEGGHVIEGNTFRNSTTLEVHVDAAAAVTIRRNTFRNTYHAVAILGRNVHVLQNDIAAPAPERVPFGWPSLAIGVRPDVGTPCTGIRIEGNTVDGHTDAVVIGVLPPDGPGAACHDNVVRDNVIRVRPLVYPRFAGPLAGQPLSGVPIRLLNLQHAVRAGTVVFPSPPDAPPWPAEFDQAAVRDNVIEGNRITGAIGVAIELIHASGNRVVGNTIEGTVKLAPAELAGRAARPPFGIGPGFWLTQPDAAQANGRAIYSTPASARNTLEEDRADR